MPFAARGGKILGPAEQAEVAAFDVAQRFPVEKPGAYHLQFEFDGPAGFEPVEVFMTIQPK